MQQVADWLEKLGLGQYAQRFAENDISFVILPDLTDQDLEKIGVRRLVIGVSCCARSPNSTSGEKRHAYARNVRLRLTPSHRRTPPSAAKSR